jgi:ABC-type branched-subunit amino acid transport system substrate-binding protein
MGINFKHIFVFCIISFLLLFTGPSKVYGQTDSTVGYDWNGDWVKDLIVEKGRTIYNLTKTYNISESELIRLNPALKDGLKSGMTIRIPAENRPNKTSVTTKETPVLQGSLRHTVKKKESLFGIAKMYGVTTDDIYALNPSVKDGLQPGMVLTIFPKPVDKPKEPQTEVPKEIAPLSKEKSCDTKDISEQKKIVKVSLLLPFYLDSETEINDKSRIGLDFYGGAKLAMDSLKSLGFNIKVQVFDTQNDTSTVSTVLRNPSFKESDLIIGPLYSAAFIKVAEFARNNKIPAVSPFSQSETLIENFPNVFKVTPNSSNLVSDLPPILKKAHLNGKFTLITPDSDKDIKFTTTFLESWKKTDIVDITEVSLKDFKTTIENLDAISENVIIFLCTDQVKIIDLVSKLNAQRNNSKIFLVGLNEWNSFENIDYDQLNNLNFTYASPVSYDYISGNSLKFQQNFRTEYKGEPNFYAYQGFDITFYFTRQIARLGDDFFDCIGKQPLECGFNSCYEYKSSRKENGFDNGYINVLRLTKFKAKRIN